jgi:hypothetical protein
MTQSMIYLVVGLVVSLVVGLLLAQQYRRDHSEERMPQWLDSHHMGWLRQHKH